MSEEKDKLDMELGPDKEEQEKAEAESDKATKDMSLEATDEEKAEIEKEGKEKVDSMALNDSAITGESLTAKIDKLFADSPDLQYIYITPDAPLCKLDGGGYSLRSIPLADLTEDWKQKIEDFIKSKGE